MVLKIEDLNNQMLKNKKKTIIEEEINKNNKENLNIFTRFQYYPKSIFFILGNEFCERFSFYGMRAILMLYIITEYNFSERFFNCKILLKILIN